MTTWSSRSSPTSSVDADCDDGAFCNGAETCDETTDTCDPGTAVDCNDGVGCTADACNEATDACDNTPDGAVCQDGLFCNGTEVCDPALDCQAGTAVDCSDGVGCTDDACNEATDACDSVANDANCDNGLFCDGAETCDAVLDCQTGADPCPGQSCDEGTDTCTTPNTAPAVTIDAPADGSSFTTADTITFTGTALDAEDGDISANLGWSSSIDGAIGSGVSFSTTLSAGSHTITASVTDSGGLQGSDAITVTVSGICAPKGDSCVADSDCCSNKCRGKTGNKSCK